MAASQTQAQTELQARRTIENLFGRLCPGRCELVELTIDLADPTPVGDVVPGFETVAGQNFASDVEAITATVLLDSKLPRNFQSNLPRMIRYRLANLAPTINVRPEVLDFPEPQLEPMPPFMPEPPRRSWEPPPLPEPLPLPAAEAEPVAEPEAEPTPEPTLWDRLGPMIEAIAPWIGPIIMMLVLFFLMMALLRRLQEVTSTGSTEADRARREIPPDVEGLRDALAASRAVRNRMLRKWLAEDPEGVARAVRLFGPQVLNDLKTDADLSPVLGQVSEFVALERDQLNDDEIKTAVGEVEARFNAARILHDEQALAVDWEFLEGMTAPNLRRILGTCGPTEVAYVVGQLPPALRQRFLESLDAADRRQLVLGTSAEVLTKDEALTLAARLRKAADDVAHIGREAEGQSALVLDMVAALQLSEQEEMLRELNAKRPELARVVLGRIVLEPALIHLTGDVMADAIHRTPIETTAAFLQGTRANVRDHVLAVAPASRRAAIMTELSLEVPVSRSEFVAARQTFVGTVRDVALRDGADLVRANARALSTARAINPVPDEALP
jgi:flagellar motor switch protein FliG